MSVINAESRYDKDAVSSQGAVGLMQITTPTAEWIAKSMGEKNFSADKLHDPETNIRMGVWYFNYLGKKFPAKELVLAAYNAGPGNVNDWLDQSIISKDGKDYEKIPFKETGNYVKKVISEEKMYDFLY
jgi:soluble lytic murein transglycosylase